MQSLGKVPSARRPPANLPSLKAETLTPAAAVTNSSTSTPASEAPGSWGGSAEPAPNSGSNASATSSQQVAPNSNSSASQANSGKENKLQLSYFINLCR